MFFGGKPSKLQNRIDTLIGAGTKIDGNVTFSGGLRVDGLIRGNINVEQGQSGTMVISENAKIEGMITVSHVVINGAVVGPVYAGEYVELQPKSHVTGDVYYKTVEMHLGAIVEGKLVYQERVAQEEAAAFPGEVREPPADD